MDVLGVFGIIAAIICLGFLSEIIFKKTNIPDVVFLIAAGIIIGQVFKVGVSTFGFGAKLFTTFALVFLLFQGALSIHFKTLVQSLKGAMTLTLLNFFFTVSIVTLLSIAMGYELLLSLLIGMILGGTSSAVVLPLVKNIKMSGNYGLILTLESAISDVLTIVGSLTIINIFVTGEVVASGVFRNILSSFSLALIVGGIAGIAWIFMMFYFKNLAKSHMMTIAAVIALYAFVESPWVKASGAIAALAFGLVIGNSWLLKLGDDEMYIKLSPAAKSFYQEISFFVKTFFFVYLGIMIDFSQPFAFVIGAIMAFGIYMIRPLAVKLAFWKKGMRNKDRVMLEVLIPKGLAAAVITQLAVQSGVPGAADIVNPVLSVILISILLTSLLIFLSEKEMFIGLWQMFHSIREKLSPTFKPQGEKIGR